MTILLPLGLVACSPRVDVAWSTAVDESLVGLGAGPEGPVFAGAVDRLYRLDDDGPTEVMDLSGPVLGPLGRPDGSVVVFSAAEALAVGPSGDVAWRAELPGPPAALGALEPTTSGVWVSGARPDGTGYLVLLTSTGILRHDLELRRPLDTPLVVTDEGDVCGGARSLDAAAGASDVRCFDLSGEELWTARVEAPVQRLALGPEVVISALEEGTLTAHDLASGALVWEASEAGGLPTVDAAGTIVVLGASEVAGYSLDGEELWRTSSACEGATRGADGLLYTACGVPTVGVVPYAGRRELEELPWTASAPAPVLSQGALGPVLAAGRIWYADRSGVLVRTTSGPPLDSGPWPLAVP